MNLIFFNNVLRVLFCSFLTVPFVVRGKNEDTKTNKIQHEEASGDAKHQPSNFLGENVEGIVLQFGCDKAKSTDYDVSKIPPEKREKMIQNGLSNIKRHFRTQPETATKRSLGVLLVMYYDQIDDRENAVYWACATARLGETRAMQYLANINNEAPNIFVNQAEHYKWQFLHELGDSEMEHDEFFQNVQSQIDRENIQNCVHSRKRGLNVRNFGFYSTNTFTG